MMHGLLCSVLLVLSSCLRLGNGLADESQLQGNEGVYSTAEKSENAAEEDDRTLLDVFGQSAKEYLTTRVVCYPLLYTLIHRSC